LAITLERVKIEEIITSFVWDSTNVVRWLPWWSWKRHKEMEQVQMVIKWTVTRRDWISRRDHRLSQSRAPNDILKQSENDGRLLWTSLKMEERFCRRARHALSSAVYLNSLWWIRHIWQRFWKKDGTRVCVSAVLSRESATPENFPILQKHQANYISR
jgi:hypothetical protein